jgi:hypothetical protein
VTTDTATIAFGKLVKLKDISICRIGKDVQGGLRVTTPTGLGAAGGVYSDVHFVHARLPSLVSFGFFLFPLCLFLLDSFMGF